jgi:hypothetical protein
MSAFLRCIEYNGNEVALRDVFNNVIKHIDTNYTYWNVLIKDYFGKNIEIKITDIEKDKMYREKGVVK